MITMADYKAIVSDLLDDLNAIFFTGLSSSMRWKRRTPHEITIEKYLTLKTRKTQMDCELPSIPPEKSMLK